MIDVFNGSDTLVVFITDTFSDAYIHPLLILLMSYSVGHPVHLVDARAKNAEPLSIKAQDNMLHIDNSPFRTEYKIIVTWQRGVNSGPKGQAFVFIPGTHHGVRLTQSSPGSDGPLSRENASIFITENDVVFKFLNLNSII